jgi:hypothetical protein
MVFCLFPIISLAKTFQNEPDGFRGIKWETDISQCKDTIFERIDPSYGGITVYTMKNDKLQIGDAKLDKIEYAFWRGKFNSVRIYVYGYTNWSGLRDACFEKFGKGFQANEYIEEYAWFGDTTSILLKYNDIAKKATLYMSSCEIVKQQKEYKEKQAQEGAKKDF